MEKLLPCPFCGGKAEHITEMGKYHPYKIKCTKCDSRSGGTAFPNEEYNEVMWNRRYTKEGQYLEALENLISAIDDRGYLKSYHPEIDRIRKVLSITNEERLQTFHKNMCAKTL